MNTPQSIFFVDLPGGGKGVKVADGSIIPVIPANVHADVNVRTTLVTENGPVILDVVDALALQQTVAKHWFDKVIRHEQLIADLRSQLNEASGEGRVYELPADVAVTPEEFGELKHMQRALSDHFGIDSVDGIVQLYAIIRDNGTGKAERAVPAELEVACRKLGFTTAGGFRAFLEHHNLRREAQLVDSE